LEICASIQVQCWLTVLCSETRPNAKPEKVTDPAKRRQCNNKTTGKMNRNANASAKSKELQPDTQPDTVAAHLLLPQPHC
jgi:hypothetical protein